MAEGAAFLARMNRGTHTNIRPLFRVNSYSNPSQHHRRVNDSVGLNLASSAKTFPHSVVSSHQVARHRQYMGRDTQPSPVLKPLQTRWFGFGRFSSQTGQNIFLTILRYSGTEEGRNLCNYDVKT